MFLYIVPLKQGLNWALTDSTDSTDNGFRIKMVARRLRWLRRFYYWALTDNTDSTDNDLELKLWHADYADYADFFIYI